MLVVLDTNVVISAMLSPTGKPATVMKEVNLGILTPCVDERILDEYFKVMHRPKFRFSPELLKYQYGIFLTKSLNVNPITIKEPFTDENDKKFYEVAKTCNALLITGNLKHFPEDPLIKSVNEFFDCYLTPFR